MPIKRVKIQNKNSGKNFALKALLIIILIFIILNITFAILKSGTLNTEDKTKDTETKTLTVFSGNTSFVEMYLPAVDADGKGAITTLTVQSTSGSGKTLVDIDNLLFWADTQQSIRVAKRVAEKVTGKSMENYNLIYSIKANASLIGGPSAGSALAIATIAAIESKAPREDVMITGTINHDGTIGPISEVLEKAKAAKAYGASIFLVPLLQSIDVIYETSQHCEKYGFTEICTTETRPKKVDINKETGIEVIEVATIEDAMSYFFE